MKPLASPAATGASAARRRNVELRWRPLAMGLGWILLGIAVALWVPGVFPAPAGPVLTPEQTFALGLSVALVLIGALEIFISNSGPFLYALYGEAGFQGMGAASCPIIVRCGSCGYVNMRGRRSCGRCRATL